METGDRPCGPPGKACSDHVQALPLSWAQEEPPPPIPGLPAASGNSLPRAFLAVSLSSLVSSVLRKRKTLSHFLFLRVLGAGPVLVALQAPRPSDRHFWVWFHKECLSGADLGQAVS